MSDKASIIAACLVLLSLYATFHCGIECERDRARRARRRRFEENGK